MQTKGLLLAMLVAYAEARFGQEQIPIPAISAVTSGGGPGVAATLAGSAVSTILAATNPCAKLQKADEIIAQLGTGADAVAAAIGLVAAEQNFNPFVVSIPNICGDPALPATQILRGILPLVDPAVTNSNLANQLSAQSKQKPFNAVGMSVAQVMAANGFTNFTAKDLTGAVVQVNGNAAAGGAAANAGTGAAATKAAVQSAPAKTAAAAVVKTAAANVAAACPPATTFVTVTKAAAAAAAANTAAAATANTGATTNQGAAAGTGATTPAQGATVALAVTTIAGLDFGKCAPTIKFEAGLNGRKATEFTFQAIDPTVNKGQQEALNPNIITNRICDQLKNVCAANQAAITACLAAKASILALGTRDASTANAWNTQLGFAGTNINPDNAPQAGLVGHT